MLTIASQIRFKLGESVSSAVCSIVEATPTLLPTPRPKLRSNNDKLSGISVCHVEPVSAVLHEADPALTAIYYGTHHCLSPTHA